MNCALFFYILNRKLEDRGLTSRTARALYVVNTVNLFFSHLLMLILQGLTFVLSFPARRKFLVLSLLNALGVVIGLAFLLVFYREHLL